MKVGIGVEDDNISSSISSSFGRAKYYLIYNLDSEDYNFILNEAAFSSSGAGPKGAQLMIDMEVDLVVSPRCGEKAARVLDMADIKILKSRGENILENIKSIDDLEELSKIHSANHKGGIS